MDQIIVNLAADAQIVTTKNNKKFVAFRAAQNKKRLNRATGKNEKTVKFYRCYYWLNTGIAEYLTKGTKVHLSGEKDASAWKDTQGNARVNHLFYAEQIEFLGYSKPKDSAADEDQQEEGRPAKSGKGQNTVKAEPVHAEDTDDLPF